MGSLEKIQIEQKRIWELVEKYYPDIIKAATLVRKKFEEKYGSGVNLCGKCIPASDTIVVILQSKGYRAKTVEGYCWYERNLGYCSDAPYGEHTWVQVYGLTKLNNKVLYVDVTGDQFNLFLEEGYGLRNVEIGSLPYCMHKGKPSRDFMKEVGWY